MTLDLVSRMFESKTRKVYRGGSARSVTPETTWLRIRPLLSKCGITRVANITGLDRVGIPVFQAIRPNARSLSTSQGKGADTAAARVSAAMEAIELFHAERPRCALRWAKFVDLEQEGTVADPEKLPHTDEYDPERYMLWTLGFDLMRREPIYVPFDLVHVNLTEPAGPFTVSSNGLASGNSLVEAVFHGLCELIERDGEALFQLRPPDHQDRALLDLGSVDHPIVSALLEKLGAAGLTPVAWDLTSDIRVPLIRVFLHDSHADPLLNPVSAPYGAGCHIDAGAALVRALTESAQTRVGWIAGSRDDLSRDHYRRSQANTTYLADLLNAPKPSTIANLPAIETETLEEDLLRLLDALRKVGIDQLIVVPLHDETMDIAIAKVIVPGLEGPAGTGAAPGPRAKALLT